ncbi:DUF6584 family protein [Nocardioides aequoreus]|uniref:DUF6584 family protein n=1 Tax=Nocardioides aequoreus TaxID=397278 RepID=UPI003CCBE23D
MQRAREDLVRGEARAARDRLRSLVDLRPDDLEVRALLAQAYRQDRQWPEAGRWGYLVESAASPREREMFEKHASRGHRRLTEARLRHLLRTPRLAEIADNSGRALLRGLPARTYAHSRGGLVIWTRCRVAAALAWWRWR